VCAITRCRFGEHWTEGTQTTAKGRRQQQKARQHRKMSAGFSAPVSPSRRSVASSRAGARVPSSNGTVSRAAALKSKFVAKEQAATQTLLTVQVEEGRNCSKHGQPSIIISPAVPASGSRPSSAAGGSPSAPAATPGDNIQTFIVFQQKDENKSRVEVR
jgi:hypothetical protein